MNCGECDADNESGARFCAQCGTSLEKACEACRAPLAESARFCSACGERVATRYALPRAAAGAQSSGERRPLTVVFCDLVGATALGRQLDPEDLRDVLRAYQHTCHEEIRRLDGHVAQYLGDGVLAYFGYPRAEEDDAERAVRAALEIQGSLERIRSEESANPNAVPVEARIGIHSGPVLMSDVGEDAAAQTLALGNAANVAARLQSMAEAGGVLVSEDTQRLLRGRFRTRSLGHPELKGLGNEVGVHEVVGLADAAAPAPSSHSPLAGRDAELEHFRTCFGEAAARSGGVMSISGEAGVGKSRLLLAFREELAETPHAWVELHCARHTRRTPFQPLIDATERLLGFDAEDDGEEKLRKLERGLATLPGIELADSVPELASLLALPSSERFPASNASAEVQRARTLDALCALTLSLAERRPLVLTCEDLHWCDPSTLDFVTALVEATPGSPLLVLTTARSEFESPWRDAPGTRHLEWSAKGSSPRSSCVRSWRVRTACRSSPRSSRSRCSSPMRPRTMARGHRRSTRPFPPRCKPR